MKLFLLFLFVISIFRIAFGVLPEYDGDVPISSKEEDKEVTIYQDEVTKCNSEKLLDMDSLYWESRRLILDHEKRKIAADENIKLDEKFLDISNTLLRQIKDIPQLLKIKDDSKPLFRFFENCKGLSGKVFGLFGDERNTLNTTLGTFFVKRREVDEERDKKTIYYMNRLYDHWIYNLQRVIGLYIKVKVNILSNNFFEGTNYTLNMMYKWYKSNIKTTEFVQAIRDDSNNLYVFLFFESFNDEFIKFDSELKNAIFYEIKFVVKNPYYEFFPLYCNDVNTE
ncbi:hypothetical protein EDEG_01591 [Edhazardia aedis USNM 41457]|uniref:Uncharacterized protein n=1 Tax=Edhazardia aedis (strain USNM 41457) TaxID=1003232 RepID=J9D8N9_EDHAE|nr:hypothetical protein EDEG_01591 [Edhazardia aedis USNM 41457]|eukprot:EJW04111.1 hypothetical protein EDEG_01591 [Edhazardia aedis USNM 41457]